MEETTVKEIREPYIEIEYTNNKSEKFAKEEIRVKIVDNEISADDSKMAVLKEGIQKRLKAIKESL